MKTQVSYKKLYAETLRDIIDDRAVLKFNPIDSVPDIMRRLRAGHAKVAGVVGVHGNLVGMLTENGIIRRIFSRFDNPSPNIERLSDHKGVSRMIALDVMIENPDTLHIDDTVEDALDMMTYLSHSYMPVVDGQKRLLGIVDTGELRRCLEKKYGALKSLDDPISLYAIQQKLYDLSWGPLMSINRNSLKGGWGDMKEMHDSLTRRVDTVGEITVNRPMLTFRADDKVEHIVREMIKHHQGAVGITDTNASGKLVGLMTERDLLRKIFGMHGETQAQFDERNRNLDVYPGTLLARNVMTHDPVCLTDDMLISDALEKIKQHDFRYMPVVKRDNNELLVGIVSEREVFWHAQEKMRRTIQTQTQLLQYFIAEPYGAGGAYLSNMN